jgi:type I restriction enzyme R subunit
VEGEVQEGKRYTEAEFNRIIEIERRERQRVEILLSQINQREKTLVFCATQEHALAIRDLINQLKSSTDPNYCHRVTADDGELGNTSGLIESQVQIVWRSPAGAGWMGTAVVRCLRFHRVLI